MLALNLLMISEERVLFFSDLDRATTVLQSCQTAFPCLGNHVAHT